MMTRLALLALALMVPGPSWAEWVRVEGAYAFGPEISQDQACRMAEDRALARAVADAQGEAFGADDLVACTEMGADLRCDRHSAVWTSLGGRVRGVRGRVVRVAPYVENARNCTVSLEADIEPPDSASDPGFTIGVELNAASFRDGDDMVLTLSPSQPMAVQVFQWLPYRRDGFQVVRLFPNAYDRSAAIDGPATIPNRSGPYSLTARFPADQDKSVRLADEFLMVVATRRPVALAEGYGIDEFNQAISELPAHDRRIVRRTYTIVRSPQ